VLRTGGALDTPVTDYLPYPPLSDLRDNAVGLPARCTYTRTPTSPSCTSPLHDARDIELIEADNEKEALALENNLIKQWKPRFNIQVRDDKTYPFIRHCRRHLRAAAGARHLRPLASRHCLMISWASSWNP
jgi:hypothetical protein